MVALLAVMQMLGMLISALAFGLLLAQFSQLRLIQVVQGTAMATMALNMVALWKQEVRDPRLTTRAEPAPDLWAAWASLPREGRWLRRLVALGLGAAAFSMQDILLEPYGGQILGLSVAATTRLTALFAGSGIIAFALAAWLLARQADAHRLAAHGALVGIIGFLGIIFSAPLASTLLFGAGVSLVGFGGGLFSVGTLTACVGLARGPQGGLVLGAWGAVQASAAGGAVAFGGVLRDAVSGMASHGLLGPALMDPTTGYGVVYLLEVVLLFATIIALGPLARSVATARATHNHPPLGLAEPAS
jgi:BCD family chlorophyll transporter-like MFS transporter